MRHEIHLRQTNINRFAVLSRMNKLAIRVQIAKEKFVTMMSLLLNTHVGKHIDGKKMIKNQITRSGAQSFVDMQNNVYAIILSPAMLTCINK